MPYLPTVSIPATSFVDRAWCSNAKASEYLRLLSIRSMRESVSSPEESLRQLLETLITILASLQQDALDQGPQPRFSPVVSGNRLSARSIAPIRALEQSARRRDVIRRVVPRRELKTERSVPGACIFVYESPRHASV
jgi:hypothetical protein